MSRESVYDDMVFGLRSLGGEVDQGIGRKILEQIFRANGAD